eukprot:TRINITY_DN62848_c0_g2_i2.p1 TRINITY_DN62848_c0_g2~~TRINITY_DN62848_c0_g2_i2.p1  ORF type:complete len:215 (-),score=27.41 TRINITY_DN62848_c0_g2_i2:331-975(-)
MRLLCLHGVYQNASSFAAKSSKIRDGISPHATMVYLSAPHKVSPKLIRGQNSRKMRPSAQVGMDHRAWWTPSRGPTIAHGANFESELEETWEIIREAVREEPCDGILGFSQGATLTSLMCTRQGIEATGFSPKLAIMIAGRSNQKLEEWYRHVDPTIRTLHLYGLKDKVNSAERCAQLAGYFGSSKQVLSYPRGHVVPDTPDVIARIHDFCQEQ